MAGTGFPTHFREISKELEAIGWELHRQAGGSHQLWRFNRDAPGARKWNGYSPPVLTMTVCETLCSAGAARNILTRAGWFSLHGLRPDGSKMSKAEHTKALEKLGGPAADPEKQKRKALSAAKKDRLAHNRALKNQWRGLS